MRLAFLGVSHWHTHLYLDPALQIKGTTVAGVSDPHSPTAQNYAARLNCPWSTDYRDLCDRVKPDFIFAFGRHCDMAEEARFLIDARIPFAMEKPCGMNSREVSDLAERAAARGSFAAIPFVFRQSRLLTTIFERAKGEDIQYLSFRFIAGPISRYRKSGCEWMLDPAQSGGGCTVNLGVHFFDLFRVFMGTKPIQVKAAVMSNAAWNEEIEDYSLVILQSGPRTCLIETGYVYPGHPPTLNVHYSLRTDHHYFSVTGPNTLEVCDELQKRETLNLPTTNTAYYGDFVQDALVRVQQGQPPLADMTDMAAVMRLVDSAYAMAGRR